MNGAATWQPSRSYAQLWIGQTMCFAWPQPVSSCACRWRQTFETSCGSPCWRTSTLSCLRSAADGVVAVVRHEALVAGVGRAGANSSRAFDLEDLRVEVPRDRQADGGRRLRPCGR